MKNMLEFSIITISTFVTILDESVKTMSNLVFKKDICKIIPLLSIIFGIILGIAGYYLPNVEMGNNIVEAIFIGLSAGSAATGVNQIGKQLNRINTSDDTSSNTNEEVSNVDESIEAMNQYIQEQQDRIAEMTATIDDEVVEDETPDE